VLIKPDLSGSRSRGGEVEVPFQRCRIFAGFGIGGKSRRQSYLYCITFGRLAGTNAECGSCHGSSDAER
jgi:hypothetical protein